MILMKCPKCGYENLNIKEEDYKKDCEKTMFDFDYKNTVFECKKCICHMYILDMER